MSRRETTIKKAFAVVLLCRFRYLSLTETAYVVGSLGSHEASGTLVALGVVALVFLRGISSIVNCMSDQAEDDVDHLQRAALRERVGVRGLRRVVAVLALCFLGCVAMMIPVGHVYWYAITLWLVYLLLKLSYSLGPRLKTRRTGATILLGGVSGTMFFLGWIQTGTSGFITALSGSLVLWAMGSSLAGSKDAPDVDGDIRVGYRSVYLALRESSRPLRRVTAIVLRPFLVAALLAIATTPFGGPGIRLLAPFVILPLALVFALVLVRAESPSERSIVRECGYLYWIVFMDVVLIALVPWLTTIAIALGAVGWYLIASLVLHPDPVPFDKVSLCELRAILRTPPSARTNRSGAAA